MNFITFFTLLLSLCLSPLVFTPLARADIPQIKPDFSSSAWAVVSPAELQQYDTLYSLSDIHGDLSHFTRLLTHSGLVTRDTGARSGYSWLGSPALDKRTLFVVIGNLIGKGDDGVGTLLFMKDLAGQAQKRGDRIIVLLGDQEVAALSKGGARGELAHLIRSAEKHPEQIRGLGKLAGSSRKEFLDSEMGDYLRSMPVGAIVGSWLFVSSGYIDVDVDSSLTDIEDRANLVNYIRDINIAHRSGNYNLFRDSKKSSIASIVGAREWWKKDLDGMYDRLRLLGLTGMVVGHEPGFLGVKGEMALYSEGWLIKADAGTSKLLKCSVPRIFTGKPTAKSMTMTSSGKAVCVQINEKGKVVPLPLVDGDGEGVSQN